MTFTELESQILSLSVSEKASILQSLIQTIGNHAKGITKIPGVCGGEACIGGTRILVWLLVEARQIGISEAQLLLDYPHLSAADLVNVWAYADAYPEEIEDAISANNEDINLKSQGIDQKEAEKLRDSLATFADDWNSPEMSIYDNYDTAKSQL